jgi:hypothetical protein
MDSHNAMWWIIWPLMVFGFMRMFRHRGPRRDRQHAWEIPWGRRDRNGFSSTDPSLGPETLLRELDAQRTQMEEMAARLSELENRADFAERLLAGPREKDVTPG